jgi:hypothetical protein
VYQLVEEGEIAHYRIGAHGAIRILQTEVGRLIEQARRPAGGRHRRADVIRLLRAV